MARMTSQKNPVSRRANDPPVLILISLSSGQKHGWALMEDIEKFAGVRLGPGSLYGAITRLEERGLIRPLSSDTRTRPYELTSAGRVALESALSEMRLLADEGVSRLSGAPGSAIEGSMA
jgi:DNA-binding PadR family transcriptional regulator